MSRLQCHSESFQADLLLDVNTQLYPMDLNQRFALSLATTLRLDGKPDTGGGRPVLVSPPCGR